MIGTCGTFVTITEALNIAARAAVSHSYEIEGAHIVSAIEEMPNRVTLGTAYLRLDYLLKNWPRSGVRYNVAALYSGEEQTAEANDIIYSEVETLALNLPAVAGIKEQYLNMPGITADGSQAILCAAQELTPSLSVWEGAVFAILPARGEWANVSGQRLNEYLSNPASYSLLQAIDPRHRIVEFELKDARLITLDRFVSLSEPPCDEDRLMSF